MESVIHKTFKLWLPGPGSAPRNVQVRPLSSSTMVIQWDEPQEQNGLVTGYKVSQGGLVARYKVRQDGLVARYKVSQGGLVARYKVRQNGLVTDT